MLNVDRWAYYTAQKRGVSIQFVLRMNMNWLPFDKMSSKQRRRIKKKSRGNNDYSIGLF